MCNKGFSLAEMLVVFLIIGVVSAAALPLLTQVSQIKTGVDKNTMQCIVSNSVTNPDSSVWYDDSDGTTSVPAGGTKCYAAVLDTQHRRGRALETSKWYADHGTAVQKVMGKRILRAACDEGGEGACDYFINTCWKSGSSTAPYCDDTASFLDLTYYLHHDPDTTTNRGVGYIVEKLEGQLPKMMANLVNEVTYACSNNQAPDVNQNLNNNISCDLSGPWLYIKGCNLGNEDACTEAHDNNWNKSCSQIKAAWPTAPTDNYKLTFRGAADLVTVSCNTLTAASAAITGCNGIGDTGNLLYNCDTTDPYTATNGPDCSNDCYIGYADSYNRSCALLVASWPALTSGHYWLTSAGAPDPGVTDPVDTICNGVDPDCTDTIGSICPDGTIYAGNINGEDSFTTPTDVDDGATFTWNDGSSNYQERYAGFPPLPNAESNGKLNHYIINRWNQIGNGTYITGTIQDALYRAAEACENLNTLGYSDWFLPSENELNWLYDYKSDFAATAPFVSTTYWSSTEYNSINARRQSFSSGSQDNASKSSSFRVRCIRNNATISSLSITLAVRPEADCSGGPPAEIGTLCTNDGTIYAGLYIGKHYYTTLEDEIGIYSWNNGTENWTDTGAVSTSDGELNTNILTTNPVASDAGTPYNAAVACATSTALGYSDWFLPSRGELDLLYTNAAEIGSFASVYYWSSTEYSYYYARAQHFRSGSQSSTNKNASYRVRCVR